VTWVCLGAVFPASVRASGQSLRSFTHWAMNAAISFAFPVIVAHYSKAAPFVFFAAMTAVQFVVVLTTYPETKGASLEDLQKRLVAG